LPRPKVAGDMFGDLLGTQGFDFSSTKKDSGPKTINAMRKEELAKDIDPDKMKVSFVCLILLIKFLLILLFNF
jgi:cyclin G-associated kinase